MRTHWPKVRLGEVLQQIERPEPVDAIKLYRLLGVRWYGQGLFVREEKIGADIAANRVYSIRRGDFVYNRLFAWKGSFAVAGPEIDGAYVSNEFPCFTTTATRLDPHFLFWYFRQERVWSEVLGLSTGATPTSRNRLKESELLEMEVPLPAVAEQRRVVARIEELAVQINSALTLRQQAAINAETLPVAMAHGWSSDRGKGSPEGWRSMPLSECIRLVDHSERVVPGQRYPNLGIFSFGRGLFPKPPIDGALTSATTLRRVTSGQFIYSRLFAFEGAYGMVTDRYDGHFVSGEYPTFECNPALIRVEFLAAYFQAASVWNDVSVGSKGLGHRRQRVQPAQLLRYRIRVPPLAWQDRLATVRAEVDRLKRLQTETSVEIGALLPAVFDRAFKGEL
jgi:type I restriction enzyme, S subunit